MIAVITKNPYFYYKITKELEKAKIEYITLDFGQRIPPNIKVVITSKEEKNKINFPCVLEGDIEEVIRLLKPRKCNHLTIGIDPGLRPGIAVLGDNRVIKTARLNYPEEIEEFLKKIDAEKILIRIGRGGGLYQSRILKILQEEFEYEIEIVDEKGTTPENGYEKHEKDIIAAINIAIKQGKLLKEKIEVSPKKGEIKELQKQSRLLSKSITISRKLAEEVAKGKLTLEEAIKRYRRYNINGRGGI